MEQDWPSGDGLVKTRLAKDEDRAGKFRNSRLRTSMEKLAKDGSFASKGSHVRVLEIPRVLVRD